MTKRKEDKQYSIWWQLPAILCMLPVLGYAPIDYYLDNREITALFSEVVICILGFAVLGQSVLFYFPKRENEPDITAKQLKKFWGAFALCELLAFICVFIPNTAWPLVAVFVCLTFYGSSFIAIVGGSVLLLFVSVLAGNSPGVFFLYFISGVFAVILFSHESDYKKSYAYKLFLTLVFLFVSLTAGVILTVNERLVPEQFLLPVVNLIITGIIILAVSRMYYRHEVFSLRDTYLTLNDTEHPMLSGLRERNRFAYLESIHTGYFCERIANVLGLNGDVLKCAGYYHHLVPMKDDNRNEFYEGLELPGEVRSLLNEYCTFMKDGTKGRCESVSGAALLISATIIRAVLTVKEKNPDASISPERIINLSMDKFNENGAFEACDITIRQIRTIHRLFLDEALYFDLLK